MFARSFTRNILVPVWLFALVMVPLCGVFAQDEAPPAAAPAAGVSTLKVGIVDLDKVSEQYQKLAEEQKNLRAWATSRASFVSTLSRYVFLSEQNFAEMSEIIDQPAAKWSDAQKKREEELRKVSEQKERRFLDLRAKNDRTPEEEDEFNSLSEAFDARRADMDKLAASVEQEYMTKRDAAQGTLVTSVRDIIVSIAGEQGFDLVLDQTTVFFNSGNVVDLTSLVIERLNKPAEG